MWGWRWEPPWEHSCGHPVQGGGDCPHCSATASTNPPEQELSQRGDPGRISNPTAPGLSVRWKYQLLCSWIKMGFIIKSRKSGWLLWMKHWLSCAFWEISRDHRKLCLSHRQCLLTVLPYIRLVRCFFWCQRLKNVTVLTKKGFQ